jgi:hypothetical protein
MPYTRPGRPWKKVLSPAEALLWFALAQCSIV